MGSLLTLRKNLNLSLESFAEAVASLELKELVTRTGLKIGMTAHGLQALKSGGRLFFWESQNYIVSVSVPKLPLLIFIFRTAKNFWNL